MIYSGTNYKGTLRGVYETSWLVTRMPLERHKKSINVGFVDGHAASVAQYELQNVRVSPWK